LVLDELKIAKVCPLYEIGDRPISMLPSFSKNLPEIGL